MAFGLAATAAATVGIAVVTGRRRGVGPLDDAAMRSAPVVATAVVVDIAVTTSDDLPDWGREGGGGRRLTKKSQQRG